MSPPTKCFLRWANLCLALQLCTTAVLCTLPIAPRAHAAGADGSWMPQWGGAPLRMACTGSA